MSFICLLIMLDSKLRLPVRAFALARTLGAFEYYMFFAVILVLFHVGEYEIARLNLSVAVQFGKLGFDVLFDRAHERAHAVFEIEAAVYEPVLRPFAQMKRESEMRE